MTYINNFGDVGPGDVAMAGGKGAIGDWRQAGLPVPPGFVLNTAAYADFVEANRLGPASRNWPRFPPGRRGPTRGRLERIRALFTGGTMPDAIAPELTRGVQRGSPGIRSPGGRRRGRNGRGGALLRHGRGPRLGQLRRAAGHLPQRPGREALAAAVTDCWASLWTARAMAYRAREGIGPDTVRLAVVVQRMVEAEAAGVMFTANPANGRRDQMVISAAWGLGESVVSGTVTTDDVVVEQGRAGCCRAGQRTRRS